MDYAAQAKQLQEARLDAERKRTEHQAAITKEIAPIIQEMIAKTKKKTEDLLPYFNQFKDFKIAKGAISLTPELVYPDPLSVLMCLKAGSVNISVMNQIKAGSILFEAEYDSKEEYVLIRHDIYPKPSGRKVEIGRFKSPEDLMNRLAIEVSNL